MIDKTRELALKILYKIDKEQAYSNIVLNDEINKNRKQLKEKDIGLISEIVYGVITWKLTLDEIIKKHSKIRLKKLSTWILNILRMGAYQIIFLDKIPKSAAVNESVNLAKRYGHSASSNFVNAILRKIEKKDYEEFFEIEDYIEKISKTTSMPQWIIEELFKNNKKEKVEEICKNSNLKPEITIRINTLKINKENFIKELQKRNIEYLEIDQSEMKSFTLDNSKSDNYEIEKNHIKNLKIQNKIQENKDNFLVLKKYKNIESLDLFKKGYFTIQDISAGLTAKILDPKPGQRILDACSAPGGKTTYIAELMNNQGKIEAWDIHEHRTKLVKENSDRLGIDIIKTDIKDATIYDEKLNEKFDKILLDVPCLGLGVIKRKPDIKWQRKKEDIEEISQIQKKILENCSKYLKPNGELVYSTCSILKQENDDVIEMFLLKNPQFVNNKKETINLETTKEQDGFYICKLYKNS